jgi:catechol 2,3-dioxygenase-like lactoylglutathione lyase family enzyme
LILLAFLRRWGGAKSAGVPAAFLEISKIPQARKALVSYAALMSNDDFKLSQISIVMLGANDLARSVEFYRDQVGLEVQSQIPGFAFLKAGAVTLALSEPIARAAGDAVSGAFEIVFPVEHVRAAFDALKAKGIAFTQEPRNVVGSMWAANFNDPDGHKLSIFGNE